MEKPSIIKTRNRCSNLPFLQQKGKLKKKLLNAGLKLPQICIVFLIMVPFLESCKKNELLASVDGNKMNEKLSAYNIFRGKQSDLIPANGFELYELPTQLFTDYAEKQRLVKIPTGSQMKAKDDGLPDFPDGTILVKTFYYYNDKRDLSKGKKIIETRLLIKSGQKWKFGTYIWNDEQKEATLLTTGLSKTLNWIDENGSGKVVSYQIPKNRDCLTCHNSGGTLIPIGPKIRNLNFDVERGHTTKNQLMHFKDLGILDSVNPSSFTALPKMQNLSVSVEDRARAYLDMNCAHCHNQNGKASFTRLFLDYGLPLSETKIVKKKNTIKRLMENGSMPKIGTNTIDEEGLLLIKTYLESL